METAQLFGLALLLAFITEGTVEYLFGTAADHWDFLKPYKWALMYVAVAVGIGLAFYYQLDVVAVLTGEGVTPVGFAISGIAIGRGANYVSDLFQRYIVA